MWGGGVTCVSVGVGGGPGDCVYFVLNFTVSLDLLSNIKSMIKNNNNEPKKPYQVPRQREYRV